MKSYNTRLKFENQEDFEKALSFLQAQQDCVNEAYKVCFSLKMLSLTELHHKFYRQYLKRNRVPAQMVIRSYKEALASFRSMKSNQHSKTIPVKTGLSVRLDKRIYTLTGSTIRLTTLKKRINAKIEIYPRLSEVLDRLNPCDPLIYEKNGEIWISLSFEENVEKIKPILSVGIDLGVRRLAATSEGNIFVDKKFNSRVRQIRFLKQKLKQKKTKSARRKSRKIGRKESRIKKAMLHTLANQILRSTKANVLVLENLKGIKHKKKKKKGVKQTSFYTLRMFLTYKAPYVGKRVETVSPRYTSQIDCLTGKKDGTRKGVRYLSKNGKVLDADLNAACNIAFRFSKNNPELQLPVSWQMPLDGQVTVNSPIAFKSTRESGLVLQAPLL